MSQHGQVSIRPFRPADRAAVLAGRDAEAVRWLGPGTPDPSPTAVIQACGKVVGWVDADAHADWLRTGEVNLGYAVFPSHRGRGYAAAAVRLLLPDLAARGATRALLVIDRRNAASLRVARALGAHTARHPAERRFPTSAVYAVDIPPACGELAAGGAPTTPPGR